MTERSYITVENNHDGSPRKQFYAGEGSIKDWNEKVKTATGSELRENIYHLICYSFNIDEEGAWLGIHHISAQRFLSTSTFQQIHLSGTSLKIDPSNISLLEQILADAKQSLPQQSGA